MEQREARQEEEEEEERDAPAVPPGVSRAPFPLFLLGAV
jgi:hypothetical protein